MKSRAKFIPAGLGVLLAVMVAMSLPAHSAPESTTLYVTRGDDSAICVDPTQGRTLRCAINFANANGTFYNIRFTAGVTQVLLTSALPDITSQGTWIDGSLGSGNLVTINAEGITARDATFIVNADDVTISDVSIINSSAFDIIIPAHKDARIAYNRLGVTRDAFDCNYPGHTRNATTSVTARSRDGDGNPGTGSAYIYGNVIGCHGLEGITLEGSWAYVGQDANGATWPNYIGVSPGINPFGNPVPNRSGVDILNGTPAYTITDNFVLVNRIAYNLTNGVEIWYGPYNSGNTISGTLIYGNGRDGLCEDGPTLGNVWSHLTTWGNGGLGINKNGNCILGPNEGIDPPFPVITSVNPATHVVSGSAGPSQIFGQSVTVELYRVFPNRFGFGEGKAFVGATTTDASGNWSITDPEFTGGCYTVFQTTFTILSANDASSEFGPDNCRTFMPLISR